MKRLKLGIGVLLCTVAALTPLALENASAASAGKRATGSVPVTITPTQSGGALDGVFNVTSFSRNSAGQIVANGLYTGTVTTAAGTQTVTTAASSALTPAAASCSILDLTLGPLHLDLLGLVVDLNQVHLTITAQPGSGNLLGNLLCAVANLLNGAGTTPLAGIVNLLNQILAAL